MFTEDQFIATKFDTAAEKAKFTNALIKFIDGGYKGRFTKALYQGLHCSGYFDFIAHYNIDGFKWEKFSDKERQELFFADMKRACIRDMDTDRIHLWSDVKKALAQHYGFAHEW